MAPVFQGSQKSNNAAFLKLTGEMNPPSFGSENKTTNSNGKLLLMLACAKEDVNDDIEKVMMTW